jgi:predicted nucleotidyltransferase
LLKNIYSIEPKNLEPIVIDCFQKINDISSDLNIQYLLVGATARDLVLQHAFDASIARATKDIDFTVHVKNWDEFESFAKAISKSGFERHAKISHLFYYVYEDQKLPVDVVPFGGVADQLGNISWPPHHKEIMSVLGFQEALENAWGISLNSELCIPVVSTEGLCMLKLISWVDREISKRRKDAQDVFYLIDQYAKVPEIFDALYDEGLMEEFGFDESKARAAKLAQDVVSIASTETIKLIANGIFSKDKYLEPFVRDSGAFAEHNLQEKFELMTVFKNVFMNRAETKD